MHLGSKLGVPASTQPCTQVSNLDDVMPCRWRGCCWDHGQICRVKTGLVPGRWTSHRHKVMPGCSISFDLAPKPSSLRTEMEMQGKPLRALGAGEGRLSRESGALHSEGTSASPALESRRGGARTSGETDECRRLRDERASSAIGWKAAGTSGAISQSLPSELTRRGVQLNDQ